MIKVSELEDILNRLKDLELTVLSLIASISSEEIEKEEEVTYDEPEDVEDHSSLSRGPYWHPQKQIKMSKINQDIDELADDGCYVYDSQNW